MLSPLLAVCTLCCRHCWRRAFGVLVAIAGVVFCVLADCRCVRALLLVAVAGCFNAYDSRALVRMPSVGLVLDVEGGVVSVSRTLSVAEVFRSGSVDDARARKHGN
jgi:O-antigen ligase